jgi:hypothetical protein
MSKLISGVTVVLCFTAAQLYAGGPALGTWTLVNGSNGQEFRSTLVVARQIGPYVEGFIDFQLKGGPLLTQVVAGTFDETSRRLVWDGREILTRYDEATLKRGTQRFECVVSHNGKEMRNFISVGSPTSGSAVWQRDGQPMDRMPELVAAIDEMDGRWRLYQQFSADYTVGGLRVLHGPDRYIQSHLARSNDEHVRELALVSVAMRRLDDDLTARTRTFKEEYQNGMPVAVAKFLKGTLDDSSSGNFSLKPISGLTDDLLDPKFRHTRDKMLFHIEAAMVHNGLRSAVKDEFRRRGAQQMKEAKPISASFKVNSANNGAVVVVNTSGKTLRHCMLFSHMVVNQKKLESFVRNLNSKSESNARLLKLAGFDFTAAEESGEATMEYNRIDKGMPAYVPEWKPGVAVEFEIAPANAISITGESMDVWVGCDTGTAQLSLNMQTVRSIVDKKGMMPTPKTVTKAGRKKK